MTLPDNIKAEIEYKYEITWGITPIQFEFVWIRRAGKLHHAVYWSRNSIMDFFTQQHIPDYEDIGRGKLNPRKTFKDVMTKAEFEAEPNGGMYHAFLVMQLDEATYWPKEVEPYKASDE